MSYVRTVQELILYLTTIRNFYFINTKYPNFVYFVMSQKRKMMNREQDKQQEVQDLEPEKLPLVAGQSEDVTVETECR